MTDKKNESKEIISNFVTANFKIDALIEHYAKNVAPLLGKNEDLIKEEVISAANRKLNAFKQKLPKD